MRFEDGLTAAEVLLETLRSPNECDQNGEPANVVDGLFAIARAIYELAKAIEGQGSQKNPEPST